MRSNILRQQRAGFLAGALLFLASGLSIPALGQQAVVTQPGQGNSGEGSGTIASSSLFQQIWPSARNPSSSGTSGSRAGCLVLNNSTDRQWVYFQGPGMAAPTAGNFATLKAESVPLEPATATNAMGGYVICATSTGLALQDAVWIAGTLGDTYVAKQQ